MSEWKAKKFWTTVDVAPSAQGCDLEGYQVLLDAKPVKTPGRHDLIAPTQPLAHRIAQEWAQQDDSIQPDTMPVTRILNTAIDRVSVQRTQVIQQLLDYIPTDTICFVTPTDSGLRTQQDKHWAPFVVWAQDYLGQSIAPTETFNPPHQSYAPKVQSVLQDTTDVQLACLHECITLAGSVLLGLAVFAQAQPVQDIWEASALEETWQHKIWGADADALAALNHKRDAFYLAAEVLSLSS